jgi:hypothetical protein
VTNAPVRRLTPEQHLAGPLRSFLVAATAAAYA